MKNYVIISLLLFAFSGNATALKQQGKTWEELRKNPQIKQVVEKLAYDSLAHFSGNALAVLDEVYGNVPNYEVVEAVPNNNNSRLINNEQNDNYVAYSSANTNVKAYPNPATDEIAIEADFDKADDSNYTLKLIEIASGRTLLEKAFIKNEINKLNLSNYANGVYVIGLEDKKGFKANVRVVKIN